jgi:hypothetical protein
MRNGSIDIRTATKMLVEFADEAIFLRIPPGATLADISERVAQLGKWHRGSPLSVSVRFNSTRKIGRTFVAHLSGKIRGGGTVEEDAFWSPIPGYSYY